jgi:hypothetical protein
MLGVVMHREVLEALLLTQKDDSMLSGCSYITA